MRLATDSTLTLPPTPLSSALTLRPPTYRSNTKGPMHRDFVFPTILRLTRTWSPGRKICRTS